MQIVPQYIPAKLQALPTEGLEEYVYWADHYKNIYDRNVKILEILKRLKELDTANDYNDRISEAFRTAILDDIAWEIKSRSLFAKYLRDS